MGIKDSSGDPANMMRMIAAVRPLRPDHIIERPTMVLTLDA